MAESDRSSPIRLEGATLDGAPDVVTDRWTGRFRIAHTGRTLSLEPEPGAVARIGDDSWNLAEVHVHHPPEHEWPGVDGRAEFHLVHRDEAGGYLVMGVVVVEGDTPNPTVEGFLADSPVAGEGRRGVGEFAPYDLLPSERTNWRYMGSLTTPPFTPGVRWICFAEPIAVSAGQITRLCATFPPNAAGTLPLSGRRLRCCS